MDNQNLPKGVYRKVWTAKAKLVAYLIVAASSAALGAAGFLIFSHFDF